MNSKWPLVPLKSILKPISRPESVDPEKAYYILGAHWYAEGLYTKDILRGSLIRASKVYRIEEGDFVYNRLFAWKGSFAVATDENHGCYVSNEFPAFAIDGDLLESRYLWRLFSLSSLWEEALGLSTGGTPTSRNRLKEEKLLEIKIPLPPLDEQRRIVARIEELAARIEEARELRRRVAEEAKCLLSSESNRIFSSISERYPPKSFGEFKPHITSGPRNWGAKYSNESFLRFYRAQDIGSNGNILESSKVFVIPPSTNQGKSAKLMPEDLMIVITGATVGRCTIFSKKLEPGYVSQHVAICRFSSSKDELDTHYLLWGLRSSLGQSQLLGQRYGQGKPGLNLTNIRNIRLPFPPLTEQNRVTVYLNALQSKFDSLRSHQSETAAALDALLPVVLERAFRGEL